MRKVFIIVLIAFALAVIPNVLFAQAVDNVVANLATLISTLSAHLPAWAVNEERLAVWATIAGFLLAVIVFLGGGFNRRR